MALVLQIRLLFYLHWPCIQNLKLSALQLASFARLDELLQVLTCQLEQYA